MAYPDNEPEPDTVTSAEELLDIIERVEKVEEDMRDLRTDRSEIYTVAKARGYDVKTIKKIVAIRKRDPQDVAEEEALLQTYRGALGV